MTSRPLLARAALFVLVLIGAASGLFLLTMQFGRVAGEEFSPYTFQRRTYSYYEVPFIHFQITPVKRQIHRNPVEEMLVEERCVRAETSSQRWDLVAAHRGGAAWRQGAARILRYYLDARSRDGARFWRTWTVEHATLAKTLWPAIAELARRRLYCCIPPLFNAALKNGQNPDEFQKTRDLLLARGYQQVAEVELELEHWERALKLYEAALDLQPANQKSVQGRAICHQKLRESPAATSETTSTAGQPPSR